MKKLIVKKIKELEQEKKIKVLFCVENGSRAWRLDSSNSDFDIRFVFVRPLNDYIKINKSDDVITAHYDKQGNKMSHQGCFVDMCGFDIFKFSKMLSASNPTVMEWLVSDMEYYGKKSEVWKEYALKSFNPIALYYHYKSMCRQNYLKYLKSSTEVTYKKYLYAMRGLLNAKWVVNHKSIPPINFTETINLINPVIKKGVFPKLSKGKEIIPFWILKTLSDIIYLKKQGKEKDIIQNIVRMDEYIESFLKLDDEIYKTKKSVTDNVLDEELRRIVLKMN